MGESGRGNNWAFGYSQMSSRSTPQIQQRSNSQGYLWNGSTNLLHDPIDALEYQILDRVIDGIRREAEECDGAPNFLLLHSLGGGSGSGLGSRILEVLRDEHPLSYISTASVLPQTTGDSPLQNLNSVMSLSFCQTYADLVFLFSNQELIDAASTVHSAAAAAARRDPTVAKGCNAPQLRGVDFQQLNQTIAESLVGGLWPADPADFLRGRSMVRDLTCSAAACDPLLKMLHCRSISVAGTSNVGTAAATDNDSGSKSTTIWSNACRKLAAAFPRFDPLNDHRPITLYAGVTVSRGLPYTKSFLQDVQTNPVMLYDTFSKYFPAPPLAAPDAYFGVSTDGSGAVSTAVYPRDPAAGDAWGLLPGFVGTSQLGLKVSKAAAEICPGGSLYPSQRHPDAFDDIPDDVVVSSLGYEAAFRFSKDGMYERVQVGAGGSHRATHIPSEATQKPSKMPACSDGIRRGSLTLIGNRSNTVGILEHSVSNCLRICRSGAYLHWYDKYGCPKEAIEDAAYFLSDVAQAYKTVHGIR